MNSALSRPSRSLLQKTHPKGLLLVDHQADFSEPGLNKAANQAGSINALLIPFIFIVLFFIGAVSFGVWAYLGKQDYKNNVTPKIDAAVTVAQQQTASAKDKEFVAKEKLPLRTYNGPSDYGSIVLQYPKTWSGYSAVATSTGNNLPVDAYFYPGIVPNTADQSQAFALRFQVVNQAYSDALQQIQSYQQQNLVQVAAYSLPKVPKTVGVMVTGQINPPKTGTEIILPLRDKTLKIWTDGGDFSTDFTTNILPNFTFSP